MKDYQNLDSVIEEFDALKSSFLAEVDSFKKRHLISCGNDVLDVNEADNINAATEHSWPRKLETVISINKIGKIIQNKKNIKNQIKNRKKENQFS